jgi:hypothetical protein
MSHITAAEIRRRYIDAESGYFFTPDTMRFFGDSKNSFGTTVFDGDIYLYRKRGALVSIFGRWQKAGREFFGAWKWNDDKSTLTSLSDVEIGSVYNHVYGKTDHEPQPENPDESHNGSQVSDHV